MRVKKDPMPSGAPRSTNHVLLMLMSAHFDTPCAGTLRSGVITTQRELSVTRIRQRFVQARPGVIISSCCMLSAVALSSHGPTPLTVCAAALGAGATIGSAIVLAGIVLAGALLALLPEAVAKDASAIITKPTWLDFMRPPT